MAYYDNWYSKLSRKAFVTPFTEYCKEVETKLENLKTEINNLDLSEVKTLAEKGRLLQPSSDLFDNLYQLLYGFKFYRKISPETKQIVVDEYAKTYNRRLKKFRYIKYDDKEYVDKTFLYL